MALVWVCTNCDCAGRTAVSEATNTPVITLEELQLGETVNTTTAAQVLHHSELYGRAAKRKSLSSLEFTQRHVGDSQGQLEEGFFWFDETKSNPVWPSDWTLCLVDGEQQHGGGSIMLWGGSSAAGPERPGKVEGEINAATEEDKPDSVCKRSTTLEKIYFPAGQWPEAHSESLLKTTRWRFWRGRVEAQTSIQQNMILIIRDTVGYSQSFYIFPVK